MIEIQKEAKAFAQENCRILRRPEYHEGMAYARHECTNYEALIAGLERYDGADQVFYWAIRERIEEMLEEAMDSQYEDDDLEDDDGDAS